MSTMTVRDITLLVTSLHYRAGNLYDLGIGIRSGARGYGRHIEIPESVRSRIERIAAEERELANTLNNLLADVSVEIKL